MAALSSTVYFSSQPQLPAAPATSPSRGAGVGLVRTRPSSTFVMVEAAEPSESRAGAVVRTKSLTEEDLAELKGCLDLGFGFSYHEIPDLCGTLPALELCYSMTRRFLDEQRAPGEVQEEHEATSLPNWRISGPGSIKENSTCLLSSAVSQCRSKVTHHVFSSLMSLFLVSANCLVQDNLHSKAKEE